MGTHFLDCLPYLSLSLFTFLSDPNGVTCIKGIRWMIDHINTNKNKKKSLYGWYDKTMYSAVSGRNFMCTDFYDMATHGFLQPILLRISFYQEKREPVGISEIDMKTSWLPGTDLIKNCFSSGETWACWDKWGRHEQLLASWNRS